ncbi:MAG: hypothetical protein KatS3mg045_1827 [Bellilinea sp.]|nr:MAG: hypothetical protein KatS3mg045_1827 [Bellilinea sp.]
MAEQRYRIEGMDCADCALKIEKGVRQLDGVERVELNFSTAFLTVEGEVSPQAVQKRVEQLGYRLQADSPNLSAGGRVESFLPGLVRYLFASHESRLALLGGGLTARRSNAPSIRWWTAGRLPVFRRFSGHFLIPAACA